MLMYMYILHVGINTCYLMLQKTSLYKNARQKYCNLGRLLLSSADNWAVFQLLV